MIHRPSIEIEYAMLAPKPFLFERAFNVGKAIREHRRLEEILEEEGVRVRRLEDEIIEHAENSTEFRRKLIEYILQNVHFYGKMDEVRSAMQDLQRNLEKLDSSTLFDYMVLEPSIDLKTDYENRAVYPTVYSNIPLANLYFMRDQQAVADKGMIIGNMKRDQRKKETEITEFFFKNAMGETNIFKVPQSSHFEGGDFMPADSFSLIGVGLRTDLNGAFSAMNSGMITSDEVVIVENPKYEFSKGDNMVNMHLDTYFNIAGDGIAVTSMYLASRAKATIYGRASSGNYEKVGESTLLDYLKSKNFNIIDLSIPEQLAYSSNFLTVRDRRIISVEVKSVVKRLISDGAFDAVTENIVRQELSKMSDGIFPDRRDVSSAGIEYINADKRGKIKIFIPGKNKNKKDAKNIGSECEVCRELNLVQIKEKIKLKYMLFWFLSCHF
ncbi:arginine deiminase family protein [Thermoplasma sp.]|uniref:arginine deiminase family protein n=1 Tax=Thermoplasma sp. TaxID=1973142 RepID=UPI00262B99E4|nr:arginine deiminase family protein [Thermoplasma sp.]